MRARQQQGEIVTGRLQGALADADDMHTHAGTVARPLVDVPFDQLCPGAKALDELMAQFR